MDISKGIVVLPPSLFLFIFSPFFSFLLYFCGLIGSFYLSIIFSSLGSFNLCSLGSFPHLRATLYILQEYKEDLHTLLEVLNVKKDENYYDVCKCKPLPV